MILYSKTGLNIRFKDFWYTKIIRLKFGIKHLIKQGQKRPLDTPKRMIHRREREGEKEKEW